jgi:hypothetical protein
VRDALEDLEKLVGVKRRFPSGDDFDRGRHRVWTLNYPSEFGEQALQLEVSLHPALRKPREVALDPLLESTPARSWALDAAEARAEKVRAACTREAIRDFYDLDRLADAGSDFTSKPFIELVNRAEGIAALRAPEPLPAE